MGSNFAALTDGYNDDKNNINKEIVIINSIYFSSKIISNWDDVLVSKFSYYKKFHRLMLNKGYYLPPSPYESIFTSLPTLG